VRRKLVLVLVDSLRTDMLKRAVDSGSAPTFAALLERGELTGDCVSSFPSVTPVCTSEIMTGSRPSRHRIPGMNWYHRAERRYVEYGSSFEATRTFGLFSALYDTVYNMNMAHLSHEVLTLYERLGDAGLRSAVTPFLIYRGRTRHELGLEGLLGRVATAARFHHAVWGPDELFYGELYASRKVPCKPTLARPDARDDYSACVGAELVERDLYDFMLFSLPDNDHYSHRYGPERSEVSITHADGCIAELVAPAGGLDAFLEQNAVIVMADHSQSAVEHELDLTALLDDEWHVLRPNEDSPENAELAIGPSSRAAGVWILREGSRGRKLHDAARATLGAHPGVDLLCWLERDGEPVVRSAVGVPDGDRAVVSRGSGEQLRFLPAAGKARGTHLVTDRRGVRWEIEGDLEALGAEVDGGVIDTGPYPDALSRVWAALHSPYASDLIVSAAPGYEILDWGGTSHVPGGSHGSLHEIDSLAPLLSVGLDCERPAREQWAISDVADLVLDHFGLEPQPAAPAVAGAAA
jgi:hypothetical protein